MGEKRQISGRSIVEDLRSGMTDSELQIKYGLSANDLCTIFEKLVTHNAISHSELCEISLSYKETTDLTRERKYRRVVLNLPVPIYDMEASATGILRDISENGLRVAGIEARVGQSKRFQIPIDTFMQVDPLLIVAECKWVQTKGKSRRFPVAGFQILDLSQTDRTNLRNFLKFLVLSKSNEWETPSSTGDPLRSESLGRWNSSGVSGG
jgi:hypothetical protein